MLLCALILTIVFMVPKLRELYSESNLRKLVSWIMINHDLPLWTYIKDAQYKYEIKKEHRITDEHDWEIVQDILRQFQADIGQSYFKGNLKQIKSKYVISGEHYFMVLLCSYLMEHQCDREFLGYDMHKETLSYKEYGSWGGQLFDATYALTDFAIIYHKLYYIACVFCKNCPTLMKSFIPIYIDEKGTEEILNTKQIKISRY